MTQEQFEAHQRRVKGSADEMFRVERSKHRPRPNTALIAEAAKRVARSKLRNVRCQALDGTKFPSKLERDYYERLLLRRQAGEVLYFTRQVPFWLEGGVKYVVDFMIVEPGIADVARPGIRFVDTTGYMTPTKRNKLKQLKARYGLDVEIVTKA